jgi:hypothetical protein
MSECTCTEPRSRFFLWIFICGLLLNSCFGFIPSNNEDRMQKDILKLKADASYLERRIDYEKKEQASRDRDLRGRIYYLEHKHGDQ